MIQAYKENSKELLEESAVAKYEYIAEDNATY